MLTSHGAPGQPVLIPPYLIAIAAGNFRYRALPKVEGKAWSTGVWAEPELVDATGLSGTWGIFSGACCCICAGCDAYESCEYDRVKAPLFCWCSCWCWCWYGYACDDVDADAAGEA